MLMLLLSMISSALAVTCPQQAPGPAEQFAHRDVLVVDKADRRVGLYRRGQLVEGACWPVALAYDYPTGPKRQQGDLRTPEGWYRTSDFPASKYYRAIYVHYPNPTDVLAGLEAGLIDKPAHNRALLALAKDELPDQYTAMGGAILIHGGGSTNDWTLGCIAMDNANLDRLHELVSADKQFDLLIRP
jgi:murein L,D-transpeptidase YafK